MPKSEKEPRSADESAEIYNKVYGETQEKHKDFLDEVYNEIADPKKDIGEIEEKIKAYSLYLGEVPKDSAVAQGMKRAFSDKFLEGGKLRAKMIMDSKELSDVQKLEKIDRLYEFTAKFGVGKLGGSYLGDTELRSRVSDEEYEAIPSRKKNAA